MSTRTRNVVIVVCVVFTCVLLVLGYVKYYIPRYVEKTEQVNTVSIPYDTEFEKDKKMWEGEEKRKSLGRDGEKVYYERWRYKYINGELKGKELVDSWSKVSKKPASEIWRAGSKKGYSTGYVWEFRNKPEFGFFDHSLMYKMDISVVKLVFKDGTLRMTLKIKNYEDSFSFADFYNLDDCIKLEATGIWYSCKTDGIYKLEQGEEGEFTWEFSKIFFPHADRYTLIFDSSRGYVTERVPLKKFWVGTFNIE